MTEDLLFVYGTLRRHNVLARSAEVPAWVYIYTRSTNELRRIVSGDYLAR